MVLSTAVAWLVMLAVGTLAWVSSVGLRGHLAPDEPLTELAFLFPLVMAIPFGFLLVVVYLPTLRVAHSVAGGGRLRQGLAGGAAGPVAGLVLLVAGRILFSNVPHIRPTIWADLEAISRNPLDVAPWILTLVIGGVVLGLGVSWSATTDAAS